MTTESPTIQQRLQSDLKDAMRAGDTVAREAIRFLLSSFKNAEIEKRSPLSADEQLAVVQRQVKQRLESVEQFEGAGRFDLVERERAQLVVIERYLPEQLGDDELEALVAAAVEESGATTARDMGKVMPLVMSRAGGRADGRRISETVRRHLAKG